MYRGDFLGTLTLVRALRAQVTKIEEQLRDFSKVPTELLRSALFDGLYGSILLLMDRI